MHDTNPTAELASRALTVIEGGRNPDALPPVALETLRAIDVTQMDDEHVAMFREMVRSAKSAAASEFDGIIATASAELVRRMKERGARAIASSQFKKIELEDVYTPYAFDFEKLRAAAKLLPHDEAAKVVKHVPEQVTVVPAHDEPGAAVSIAALVKKYGAESEVGKLLSAAMTRSKVDEKLVVQPLPARAPQVVDGGAV